MFILFDTKQSNNLLFLLIICIGAVVIYFILALIEHGVDMSSNNQVTIQLQNGAPITEENIRLYSKKFYHDSNYVIEMFNVNNCSKTAMAVYRVSRFLLRIYLFTVSDINTNYILK